MCRIHPILRIEEVDATFPEQVMKLATIADPTAVGPALDCLDVAFDNCSFRYRQGASDCLQGHPAINSWMLCIEIAHLMLVSPHVSRIEGVPRGNFSSAEGPGTAKQGYDQPHIQRSY